MDNAGFLDYDSPSEQEKRLLAEFSKYVVGQDRAVKRFVRLIMHANALNGHLRDPNKPAGIFLAIGPSGVGKTWMAKVFAKLLFGDFNALKFIDCTHYKERWSVSKLIGTSHGYLGFDAKPELTQRELDIHGIKHRRRVYKDKFDLESKKEKELKKISQEIEENKKYLKEPKIDQDRIDKVSQELERLAVAKHEVERCLYEELLPYTLEMPGSYPNIILCDELLRAETGFYDVLLNILENGSTRVSYQKSKNNSEAFENVSFRNSFIYLTANIAEEEIQKITEGKHIGFAGSKQRLGTIQKNIYNEVMRQLKRKLPPAFLRRIGKENIIVFNMLSREDLFEGLERILLPKILTENFSKFPITLEITQAVKEYLVDESYDDNNRSFGMSALQQVLQVKLVEPLSSLIQKTPEEGGLVVNDTIKVDLVVNNGAKRISFDCTQRILPSNQTILGDSKEKMDRDSDIRTFDILE